jgi:hypothetical protein
MSEWFITIETFCRALSGGGLLWLGLRLALAPAGIEAEQGDTPRSYSRLVLLGGGLGLACGLDWFWFSWLFIFFIYLKSRKWLPLHKVVGHNLFWLGYLSGAGFLIGLTWLLQGSLWLRVNQFPVNGWLWFGLVLASLAFLADGLNRLRLRNAAYRELLRQELILVGLLLITIIAGSYFDIFRLVAFVPVAWVCYRPALKGLTA